MAVSKTKKSLEDMEYLLQDDVGNASSGDAEKEQVKNLRLDYFLSEDDFYDANMRYMYTSPKVIIAMALCFVLLFQLIWSMFIAQITAIGMMIAAIAMPVVIFPLMLKNQSKKMIDRHVAWEKHQHITFTAKGITATGKKTGHKYKWEEFYQIKESQKYFIFNVNNAVKYILPKIKISGEQREIIRGFINNSSRKKRTHLLND